MGILVVSVFITQSVDPEQVSGKPVNARLANMSAQSQLRGSSVTSGDLSDSPGSAASPSVSVKEVVENNCLFDQFYFDGCFAPKDGGNACKEGCPGWEGGKASDYCLENGNGYCHKGYQCQCRGLFKGCNC